MMRKVEKYMGIVMDSLAQRGKLPYGHKMPWTLRNSDMFAMCWISLKFG